MSIYSIDKLIGEARRLAVEYRKATGKTLAVSAEIAKHDCARLLGLDLLTDESLGYDAVGTATREGLRYQIKGRAIFDPRKSGQRVGQVKEGQDWDRLALVLMDENFEPFEIHEADREVVLESLEASAGSRRARRGVLSVARFKAIGRPAWTREQGLAQERDQSLAGDRSRA